MLKYGIHGIVIAALCLACSGNEEATEDRDAGPMEKAGRKIDEMGEKTAEKMEEMGDSASAALSAAYLHTKVRAKLLDGLGTDALRIEIDVMGDRVALSGTVRKAKSTELAKELAETVDGVGTVEAKLMHKPASSDDPDMMETAERELGDAATATAIRLAMLDAIGTEAIGIDIDISNGAVVLSGDVDSVDNAEKATAAARAVESVKSVENELESGS